VFEKVYRCYIKFSRFVQLCAILQTAEGFIKMILKKQKAFIFILLLFEMNIYAQYSIHSDRFSIHAQTTIIYKYKPSFQAPYTGDNSLQPQTERKTSVTSTLFFGAALWKGAALFVNPELAGGSGLS